MRSRGTLLLALLPFLLLLGCGVRPEAGDVVRVDHGWEYRWDDSPRWQGLPSLELPPRSGDADVLWMRVQLPSQPAPDPALLLPVVIGVLDLYVDGELVERADPGGHEWQPVHFVRLPAGARELVLRLRPISWVAGVRGPVLVGSSEALLRERVVRDLPRIGIVSILVVAGLLGVLAMRFAPARRMTAYFALYALGSAGYTLFYTPVVQVLAPGFPFWVLVWGTSVSLMPIGALGLLETLYGRGSRDPLRLLRIGHVALLLVQLGTAYGIGPLATLLWDPAWGPAVTLGVAIAIRAGVVLTVVVGIPRLVVEARGPGSDARVVLAGVLAIAAVGLWDVWASFGLDSAGWTSLMPYGTAGLLLALALVVARRYVELVESFRREIDLYERERRRMLRDLHDGIGGITTNIRLLSDMERARDGHSHAGETLRTISELSAEGLAQIRGYAQILEEPTSWEQLASELRRAATQVLEPHGFALRFARVIEPGGAPPRTLVCMSIWRIYRELLTNVAKYAAAGEVKVVLAVGNARVSLRVENECAPAAREMGVGEGRGLGNMRARALELGGRFDASFDGRAQVSLELPLTHESPGRGTVGGRREC